MSAYLERLELLGGALLGFAINLMLFGLFGHDGVVID